MINIKMIRGQLGLTQVELAKKSGISRNTMNRIENGNYEELSVDTAKKITNALNINIFDFYGIDIFKISPDSKENIQKIINLLKKELEKCL